MVLDKNIQFDFDLIQKDATHLFVQMNNLEGAAPQIESLKERMFASFETLKNSVEPKAVVRYFDSGSMALLNDTLHINGKEIRCRVFNQIKPDSIKGVYICFVSIGNLLFDNALLGEQFALDLWGTAFVDAVRIQLAQLLGKDAVLSEEFGPGFFGMDIKEMHTLAFLAGASRIGISVNQSGMLIPEKSCGVMYFDVANDCKIMNTVCKQCSVSNKNCSLCNYSRR